MQRRSNPQLDLKKNALRDFPTLLREKNLPHNVQSTNFQSTRGSRVKCHMQGGDSR